MNKNEMVLKIRATRYEINEYVSWINKFWVRYLALARRSECLFVDDPVSDRGD